jgi:hypothetical protein
MIDLLTKIQKMEIHYSKYIFKEIERRQRERKYGDGRMLNGC